MSDVMIRVENLGKKYIIGHQAQGQSNYVALRDVLTDGATSLVRRFTGRDRGQRETQEEFWALKDVSFEVKRGDCVGIIGRNGAGKSTLLKILSRITEPTTGRIELNGRVASLLEVGTGFHPELTGRENIYLNGAILGMSRAEIKRKFDEIVDFAEVEKFLDTPVKHYSSGMYVRLAFAVAAHLEPEILIVDEVLAVGDAGFQKKCLGKMGEVSEKEGRTVLFVSHQMDMIQALCERCILLGNGLILLDSYPAKVIETYLDISSIQSQAFFQIEEDESLELQIVSGKVLNSDDQVKDRFDVFEKIAIELDYIVREELIGSIVKLEIKKNETVLFWTFDTDSSCDLLNRREKGFYQCRIELPCPLLKPGSYSISVGTGVANHKAIQDLDAALGFEIELISQSASLKSYASKRPGMIAVLPYWRIKYLSPEKSKVL